MGILCVFCVYDTIGNRCFEKTSFPKTTPHLQLLPIGLGAKSQILSSVAPPRKKMFVTIFSQGHVWGPQKPMFY